MVELLTVESERFIGKFKADRRTDEFWGGNEYTEYKYTGFWYEEAKVIEDKNTSKKYFLP